MPATKRMWRSTRSTYGVWWPRRLVAAARAITCRMVIFATFRSEVRRGRAWCSLRIPRTPRSNLNTPAAEPAALVEPAEGDTPAAAPGPEETAPRAVAKGEQARRAHPARVPREKA